MKMVAHLAENCPYHSREQAVLDEAVSILHALKDKT
jgi:hypothetical protein